MNKKITILLISLLAMTITANAEVLNLTHKNSTWYEVLDGEVATLTYQPTGETFNYTLNFTQNPETFINYSLIYYKDVTCNPTEDAGIITVISSGISTFSGDFLIDRLPALDDANANTSCNYNYSYGAKLWLVPSEDVNGTTLNWGGYPSKYLFEENIRDGNGTEINGTSKLITYTKPTPAITPTPTPTPAPTTSSSSSSSPGQGGSGVNSNEPFSNIAESDRKVLDWRAGSQVKYAFKHGVYEVIINAANNENEVMVKYEGLKGISSSVSSPPPGTDAKYFNLYSGSKRFKSAIIRFKSEQSPVLLYRWTNGNWEAQSVFEIGREGNNILYESEVKGFSNFAISSSYLSELPTIEVSVTPQATPIPTPTSTPSTTPAPTITPSIPGFNGILFLIAGIVALGIFKFRKN